MGPQRSKSLRQDATSAEPIEVDAQLRLVSVGAGHALVPLLIQFGLSRRKFQLECLCDLGKTFVRRP